MNKDTKKKKNPGSGLAFIIFLIAFLSARSDKIKEFFWRLRYISADNGPMIAGFAIAAGILIILVVVVKTAVSAAKRERKTFSVNSSRGGTAAAHSHDRITGYANGECGDSEHWRKQLDGFLAAGIIDRSEYRVLLDKRKISYSRRTK